MIDALFSSKRVVEKALDASWLRNEAISNNIANADTPGYKKKTVAFEEYLAKAVNEKGRIDPQKLESIPIKINSSHSSLKMRIDENNVDIDVEMSNLAKNTIKYEALLKLANYSSLKTVLTSASKA